jgi:hypothetical protein
MNLTQESEVEFLGFALSNCTVNVSEAAAKYLRIVHRTALELAVQNQFGCDVGGFWLLTPQIEQLLKLPRYYSTKEAPLVRSAIEAYLAAQVEELILTSPGVVSEEQQGANR